MQLQPIKHNLHGSKMEFKCRIWPEGNSYDSSILEHIGNELLPIVNTCRIFKFQLIFLSDSDYYYSDFFYNTAYSAATSVITKIFQFEQIDGCSHVFLDLILGEEQPTELPVDVVANWLDRTVNSDAMITATEKETKERILEIDFADYVPNVSEMLNCLKTVSLFIFTK